MGEAAGLALVPTPPHLLIGERHSAWCPWVTPGSVPHSALVRADSQPLPQVKQMFAAFPPDVCGNLDYRNLCYVITHGEEKD